MEKIGHHAAIWFCFCAGFGQITLAADDPVSELSEVEIFSIGGLDEDGRLNRGEMALRAILKRQDAFEVLRKLIVGQSPETTAYALAGIRQNWPDHLSGLIELANLRDAPIRCGSGKSPYQDSLEKVIAVIESGNYVDWLRKPFGSDGKRDPVAFLEKFSTLVLGLNDWSKELSAGEKAFREILDRPNGKADFITLSRSSNPGAVGYGLLGLRSLAPKQFEIETERIKKELSSDKRTSLRSSRNPDVSVDKGCFGSIPVPITELIDQIVRGKFDHHFPIDRMPAARPPEPELPDPWPKQKR